MNTAKRGLAAAALSLALLGTAGTGTAAADASGCTYTSFPAEYVCGNVYGDGLHVDEVEVIRGKLEGAAIYDLHGKAKVETPGGSEYWFSGDTVEGKTFGRQYVTVEVNQSFPDGSKICARAYERGEYVDAACFDIHD
jgi:hypothetical protein